MEALSKIKPHSVDSSQWKAFIEGNNEAVSEIYDKLLPKLLFTAYNYVKNKEDAKDIVAQVFEKLLLMNTEERHERLSGVNEKLETFLIVLVKNRSLNHVKGKNNRRSILKNIPWIYKLRSEGQAAIEKDFHLLVQCLSKRQNEVFNFHHQGYKNKEIAERLDVSEQTVKNTLSSARKNLRSLYYTFME